MKASLGVSVIYGVCYKDFKTFNTQEIHQNVVLYILHGVSTSPQL